jgi:mutator protein MutT
MNEIFIRKNFMRGNCKMAKKPRLTSGAIIFSQGESGEESYRFLVVQRAKDDHFPLHWEFPRGSCDKGETMVNCMMREVKEETGLEVKPVKYLGKTEYYSEVHKNITQCHIFLTRTKSLKVKMNANGVHEHEDGKWLVPEVVREMVLPDQRMFIDRAIEYLKPMGQAQISDPSKKPSVVKE